MSSRTPTFPLYLVTDRKLTLGRDLLWVLEQAFQGGVEAVQLREKDLEGRDLYLLAEQVKALCDHYHVKLLINDRVDIAMAMDADGVHLTGTSMPVTTARQLLGETKLIGASTHSLAEALAVEEAGADFLVFGPVYFTPSKAVFGKPQGLDPLKKVVEKISIPVYPIGGIKPDRVADLKAIGIGGVALISAIISAPYPRKAAEDIIRELHRVNEGHG